jgi:hypothetical protein
LPPQHGASSGCGWRNGLQLWKVATNTSNKQPWTNDKGWSSSLEVDSGANNLTVKNKIVTKIHTEPRTWMDSLAKRPNRLNMDMRFGVWNVCSLYKASSLVSIKITIKIC